ncbi:hypothetical protein [Planomonospora venezuelensis]|uniref:Uncharacterized protein n=1 Tax=Planomonospora venezuelensis TaxID=1999 RepID=A0A841DC59_PLAVE|nr:hypothetical protein [Planomonospora venezuelensis]MBB5965878.1 hypothetical protein [Planomonospora venezuelensis]GIN04071.1 hypothetical protein Pve01_57290 [Planomonospora venezuelensis]
MADHNDTGSRGPEDAPRDPEARADDTTELPAPGRNQGENQEQSKHTPADDPPARETTAAHATPGPSAPGPAGPPPPTGPYGPYSPGGPGWKAPGWTTTTTATATQPPATGRYTRLTRAARGKPFQIIAAALIGALLGGGTVAVLDRIGDRHRAGHIAHRMDAYRTDEHPRPQDDRGPLRQRIDPDGERGYRGEGPRLRMPRGDISQVPRFCEPIEGGFKCTLRSPESAPTTPTPSPTP